jgi:glutathione synthase/RimK-type ligase-like ATP-grasp enzyme
MNIILRPRGSGFETTKGICSFSSSGLRQVKENKPTQPNDIIFAWGHLERERESQLWINSLESLRTARYKPAARALWRDRGVNIPRTWLNMQEVSPFPENGVIIRPRYHQQGQEFYFYPSFEAMRALSGQRAYYVSEFIPKDREFRIFVIQGRVLAVAEKFVSNPEQKAWNHSLGGSFDNIPWGHWPKRACKLAIRAMEVIGLDFGAVDLIREGSQDYVLEINTAPQLESNYRRECFARAFDYIVRNGKAIISLPERVRNWRDLIHPVLVNGE